jgi:hypothetical protein
MKRAQYLIASLVLTLVLGTISTNAAGPDNGPNSGNGGNSQNNSGIESVLIYHSHGNGTYSMMAIPLGSMAGHAAHGDLWYHTGCPLTGGEHDCE